jgi:hypothetical protein
MGVGETIALVAVGLTGVGMLGAGMSSAIKALWSISKGLGAFEGKILEILNRHDKELASLDERFRHVEDKVR